MAPSGRPFKTPLDKADCNLLTKRGRAELIKRKQNQRKWITCTAAIVSTVHVGPCTTLASYSISPCSPKPQTDQ